jgi:DNA adenine methylase
MANSSGESHADGVAPRRNTGGAYATPLRYPGGKGRLGPWFGELIRHNRLSGGWYVEPYAGGAGAALYLLFNDLVSHIVVNDIDPRIYAFWTSVTRHTEKLIHKIRSIPPSLETWEQQKIVAASPGDHCALDVGFATFFLNRTNRSGILSAGLIGGKGQHGNWKLDARYNRDVLCDRIARIGSRASQITVLCMDALDLVSNAAPGFPNKCLVYFDPPYFKKGGMLYENHYEKEDHKAISNSIKDARFPLVVTYDDCAPIRRMYQGMRSATFSLHYSTHNERPRTSEALFYKNLELPSRPRMTRGFQF